MIERVPLGPAVRTSHLLAARAAAGRWLHDDGCWTGPTADVRLIPYTTGIYLIVNWDWRLVRLGQASRDDDVAARICEHLRHPGRAFHAARIHVVGLVDHTPESALSCIEGTVADILACRGRMGSQRWPPSSGWELLCA